MNLKQICFTEMLIEANDLDLNAFQSWAFSPGMLFNSPDKWWGDSGRRDFPHEGVDFCLYKDHDGRVRCIGENIRIPVMHSGLVRALFTDYLGQAVIIEHENAQSKSGKLLSVYAHTRPLNGIQPGVAVKQGDIIASIADTSRSKANILPHLHLSFGHPSPAMVYDPFVWDSIRNPNRVTLVDPMTVINWPWQVLRPGALSGEKIGR
ncbi:MAG: peptidoglycan DD-metalloendopeptidase family protein [Desulfobacterales bacterium]|nr:peptidoglycan DD-metalloendopeptidase family protein [Desulfobacterales bacterium]